MPEGAVQAMKGGRANESAAKRPDLHRFYHRVLQPGTCPYQKPCLRNKKHAWFSRTRALGESRCANFETGSSLQSGLWYHGGINVGSRLAGLHEPPPSQVHYKSSVAVP